MISKTVCVLSLCAAVAAPAAAEPGRIKFGQWTVSCDGEMSPSNCAIEQELKLHEDTATWARIRVTFDTEERPEVQFIVPHTAVGGYVYYAIANAKYMKLPLRCHPGFCEGRRLNEEWLRDISRNYFLWVWYKTEEGASIPIPFIVPGIEDAINALTKSN